MATRWSSGGTQRMFVTWLAGLAIRHAETYRARWPTLMTYHHTLFVLDKDGATTTRP